MNVSLVSPYRGAIFELSGIKMQPLGISYVGASLGKAGHNIQIELLKETIKRGISSVRRVMGRGDLLIENPGMVQFSILTPYPGTALWNEVVNKITTRNWDLYYCMRSVFQTEYIYQNELENMLFKAYTDFYRNPKRVIKEISGRKHYGRPDIKNILKILKALRIVFNQ